MQHTYNNKQFCQCITTVRDEYMTIFDDVAVDYWYCSVVVIYKPNIAINWLVCTCGTVNVCGAWNGNNCYALLYRYHEMSSYRGYATLKGQIRC